MHHLAHDPHRFVLDRLIELSGPSIRWVPITELAGAVAIEGFDTPQESIAFLTDYLKDLEERMAVERNRVGGSVDAYRPTTLAIETLIEASEIPDRPVRPDG
jgi:hypothetical protein